MEDQTTARPGRFTIGFDEAEAIRIQAERDRAAFIAQLVRRGALGLARLPRTVARSIARRREQAAAYQRLMSLNDYLLADIGVDRANVSRVLRAGNQNDRRPYAA